MDQFLKFLILSLQHYLPIKIIPGLFGIYLAKNTGIAFGLFQGNNPILVFISILVLVALLCLLYKGKITSKVEQLALTLILAGTTSNLIDRLFRGAVVDYISLLTIPIFNLADACLTIGAFLIVTASIAEILKKKGLIS